MTRLRSMLLFLGISTLSFAATSHEGVRRVSLLNYTDCIELSNDATTVILGHHAGGRVRMLNAIVQSQIGRSSN